MTRIMTKCLVKNGICYSTIPLMKMMNFMAFNKVVLLTLFCCFLLYVFLVTGNTCFCDQF